MNIQFSFVMLIVVFLFYVVSAGLLILLGAAIKQRRWKWAVISPLVCAAIAAPWIDEVVTAWNFKRICQDAGVQIIRSEKVEGFYDDTGTGTSKAGPVVGHQRIAALEKSGYLYRESRLLNGEVARVEKVDGRWIQRNIATPTARFHFARPMNDVDAGRGASCSEDVVLDTESRATIARYRYCKRYASFPERLWLGLLHAGPIQYCPIGQGELKGALYHRVLVPKHQPLG